MLDSCGGEAKVQQGQVQIQGQIKYSDAVRDLDPAEGPFAPETGRQGGQEEQEVEEVEAIISISILLKFQLLLRRDLRLGSLFDVSFSRGAEV